jgi:hypothetical protein
MNQQDLESLSALMDGQLEGAGRERLIARLREDRELQGRWHRFHLIGDCLRGEASCPGMIDVGERVRRRLESEPTVLAPHPVPRRRRAWLRPAASLAIAASLGAAVVWVLPRSEPGLPGAGPQVARSDAAAPIIVVEEILPAVPRAASGAATEADLQRYLTVHSEYAASGMKGPLPLAMLVGYDARR